jgi:Rrf2 family protein
VRVTAKVDYAVRAVVALARTEPAVPVKRDALAADQDIPPAFLDDILRSLRNGQLLASQRGAAGGWRLARSAAEISVADIIRAVEGPMAAVRGIPPHELVYERTDAPLPQLWVAVRAALRHVLEETTVADLAAGRLPPHVEALVEDPDAWLMRRRPT